MSEHKRASKLFLECATPYDDGCMIVLKMEVVLVRILKAHDRSEVDWEAMKEAKIIIGDYE